MADNNTTNESGNINESIIDYIETMSTDELGVLRSIDLTLKGIARNDGIRISQSSMKDYLVNQQRQSNKQARKAQYKNNRSDAGQSSSSNDNRYKRSSGDNDLFSFDKRTGRVKAGQMFDSIVDKFEDTLTEGLFGTKRPMEEGFKKLTQNFMKSLNVDQVSDLGPEMAKRVLAKLDNAVYSVNAQTGKTTSVKDQLIGEFNFIKDKANDIINSSMSTITRSLGAQWEDIDFFDMFNGQNTSPETESVNAVNDTLNEQFERTNQNIETIIDAIGGNQNARFQQEQSESAQNDLSIIDAPSYEITDIVDAADDISDVAKAAGDAASNCTELSTVVGQAAPELGQLVPQLGAASGELGALAGEIGPVLMAQPELLLAIGAAILLVDALSDALGPAIEGISSFSKSIVSAANRTYTSYSKFTELAKKRLEADITSIREAAFKVIEDAANRVEQVWDNVEGTIAATQQYNKAEVQDLWSQYAQRLKDEGLSKVVSSADIMEKLESVLRQGLSGAVAQEFAYQATLLNSMIPTEDFFQYASTYASIAANAIKNGEGQDAAINRANQELQEFADNLLHASRDLSGGFTTTLVNSSDLFAKSAEIALTAHTAETNKISRLLTSVSGVVGSIAPDLATDIVDAIYKAAVGGNSSDITALRSMAGVGAGNTAFLQALVNNPKDVIVTLFSNLANLQNMSSANYMEVAEGLSNVFGMSMSDFARVDFQYLADQISKMNDSTGHLDDNLKLLADGQTTSNDAQMRMQKINEYMIEEGLAYVLDNEVARAIQEHMWQEQLNRELQEATYAVDLQGAALDALTGIGITVAKVLDIITGAWIARSVTNIALTAVEQAQNSKDVQNILNEGKVGAGNAEAYTNLITRGQNLKLAAPIATLLGGISEMSTVTDLIDLNKSLSSTVAITKPTETSASTTKQPAAEINTQEIAQRAAAIRAQQEAQRNEAAQKELLDRQQRAQQAYKLMRTMTPQEVYTALYTDLYDSTEAFMKAYNESALEVVNYDKLPQIESEQSIIARLTQEAQNSSNNIVNQITDTVTDVIDGAKNVVDKYFNKSIVGKSISSLINSGDWRTNKGFNALYQNYGASGTDYYESPTQKDAKQLSEKLTKSIDDYVKASQVISTSLDGVRKQIAENPNDMLSYRDLANLEEQGVIEHRTYYTNAEMVDIVASKLSEISASGQQTSFEDWLAKFEKQSGIGNLSAFLSDYGESIESIRDYYLQQQTIEENALSKARNLHEVQFWEDAQNFFTVDWIAFVREWQRYYIEHEAYTKATAEAYNEAVKLSVEEKGEMGDSVLALAEALIENNNWNQENLVDELKDPQVQTNVLLSKILLTIEAIMQQNNESAVVAIPTALSALGLSITNS